MSLPFVCHMQITPFLFPLYVTCKSHHCSSLCMSHANHTISLYVTCQDRIRHTPWWARCPRTSGQDMSPCLHPHPPISVRPHTFASRVHACMPRCVGCPGASGACAYVHVRLSPCMSRLYSSLYLPYLYLLMCPKRRRARGCGGGVCTHVLRFTRRLMTRISDESDK